MVLCDSAVVSHLYAGRAAVGSYRRVVQLRFCGGIRVFGDAIVVSCPYARRAAIVIPSGVVQVGVRYRIVVARNSPRIVLVGSNRYTVGVVPNVLDARVGDAVRVEFHFPMF